MNENRLIGDLSKIAALAAEKDVKALIEAAKTPYDTVCEKLVAHAKGATYQGYTLDLALIAKLLEGTSIQLNKTGAVQEGKLSAVVIRTICYIIVAELVRSGARVHPEGHNPFARKNPQDTTSFVVLLAPGDLRPTISIEEAEHFLEKLPQNWLWVTL
jgi:hypothetical protein